MTLKSAIDTHTHADHITARGALRDLTGCVTVMGDFTQAQCVLGGAALFGVGWGLGGLCPGPALAGLVTGSPFLLLFVGAMIAGQWLAARFE